MHSHDDHDHSEHVANHGEHSHDTTETGTVVNESNHLNSQHGEAVESAHVHSHSHSGDVDFWVEFTALMGSPAHWLFELVTSVVFYLIFGLLFYQFIIVKHVMPRVNRKLSSLHEELDAEHGIEHIDDKVYRKGK